MTKKDLVVKALESMGYKPKIDNDGDVMFHYQWNEVKCESLPYFVSVALEKRG